ncbi:MAG: J domain-containing protein [Cuniculiplasma sp.]
MDSEQYIPFTEFGPPHKVSTINGHIHIKSNLSDFRSKKIYQHLFIYWVLKDSILTDKKGIIRAYITGDRINSKPIFRRSLFDSNREVFWSLKLPEVINNFCILSSFTDGNTSKNSAYYSIDEKLGRKDRKLIHKILMEAVNTYGFPGKDDELFYEYFDSKRYKNKYGYEPENKSTQSNEEMDREMFRILEMEPTHNPEVIKSSYRKMVRKYHPDLSGDSDYNQYTVKIKEINSAYEYLMNKFSNQ